MTVLAHIVHALAARSRYPDLPRDPIDHPDIAAMSLRDLADLPLPRPGAAIATSRPEMPSLPRAA